MSAEADAQPQGSHNGNRTCDADSSAPAPPPAGTASLTAAPTALPSVAARVWAFLAIVIAALCGGITGYATGSLGCDHACAVTELSSAAAGALIASAGVAALASLVLRSVSEWEDQASASRRQRSAKRRGRGSSITTSPPWAPSPGAGDPPAPGRRRAPQAPQ